MRPTIVKQDGIQITQEHPDHIVIDMNGSSITLTEENTELLRVMLYEAYRSKRWKRSRAEKRAENKALYSLARAQGKTKPDAQTKKVYERMMAEKEEISTIEITIPDYSIEDFLK